MCHNRPVTADGWTGLGAAKARKFLTYSRRRWRIPMALGAETSRRAQAGCDAAQRHRTAGRGPEAGRCDAAHVAKRRAVLRWGCDAAPETSSTATYAVSAGAQGSGTGFHQYSIREFADELSCVLAISTRWSGDNRMQTRF
jgi:hypothetical protein